MQISFLPSMTINNPQIPERLIPDHTGINVKTDIKDQSIRFGVPEYRRKSWCDQHSLCLVFVHTSFLFDEGGSFSGDREESFAGTDASSEDDSD